MLADKLRQLPDSAFLDLQYFQTQVGCPNICAMCSQGASKNITAMTRKGLRDLLHALKTVVDERFPSQTHVLGRGREEHKPGVIFPYLDTDVGSDRNLYDLIKALDADFNCKTRIATVGYSRHNSILQTMHERIASELPHAIDGFRISFTPYTYGLHDREGTSAKTEYIQDLANLLKTYRPLLATIGAGKEKFAVEIRHKPLVRVFDRDLDEKVMLDRHVLRSGPYLLLGQSHGVVPQNSVLTALKERSAEFSRPALPYLVAISDQYIGEGDWEAVASHLLQHMDVALEDPGAFAQQYFGDSLHLRRAGGYCFENTDGPFYSIDPTFLENGQFASINFYGKTHSRRVSGYNDATRHLLNTILDFKRSKGLSRRDPVPDATWEDVEIVLQAMQRKAEDLHRYDTRAFEHLESEILPLVQTYVAVLKEAGYEPHYFFNRNFTIDTGQIVNQGRAITQFKGLASKEDDSLTAHDMRGYGKDVSFSAMRDHVWRIAPLPMSASTDRIQLGYKNPGSSQEGGSGGAISVSKLDRFNLYPVETVIIEGVEVERFAIGDARRQFMLPGMTDSLQSIEKQGTIETVSARFDNLEYNEDTESPIEDLCERLQRQAVEKGIHVHVVCGVVLHGSRALVVTRALSEKLAPGSPEMPGGGVEPSEKLTEAIRRELQEEIGVENMEVVRLLGHFDITYNDIQTRQFAFMVRVDSESVALNADEHMSHEWVDLLQIDGLSKFKFHSPGEEAMLKRVQQILTSQSPS